eukprot:gene17672-9326_t
MGLVKTYQRYSIISQFGVIGSSKSNAILFEKIANRPIRAPTEPNVPYCAATAANEDVIIWDMRKGEQILVLRGEKHEVTSITKSHGGKLLATGYADGAIKIWDLRNGSNTVTLSGHKSAITSLAFDALGSRLVSGARDTDVIVWDVVNECGLYSSKDTLIKLWDLDTQHCFLTLVGHRSEVWSFIITKEESRLIAGSSDSELRIWDIEKNDKDEVSSIQQSQKRKANESIIDGSDNEEALEDERLGPLKCKYLGSIMRESRDRVAGIIVDQSERYIACHGTDNLLEVFRICTQDEIAKQIKKKTKKLKKKLGDKPDADQEKEIVVHQTLEDEIQRIHTYKMKSKIRSCDIAVDGSKELKVLMLFNNNSIGLYKVDQRQTSDCTNMSLITGPGHRSDPRTVCFNTDGTCILSGSAEGVKIWNRSSRKCIRTFESEYSLCSFFVPGDRHAVVGTKTGKLELFDIAAGVTLETVAAHEAAIWGLTLAPDKKGFVSGSADHEVKFWEFELIDDSEYSKTAKRLSMIHTRTLKMSEDVLAVKYSPDQRLLAVSLLDSTVKVFFSDTLKFFLSLYGHKLPVLCMDISSDSNLIITGSSDKNIKIWGLDFGDCHKSIFAHDDSVMDMKFVPRTHYFFSVSKDRTVKYWDADKYENIMVLQGHQAEVWCLAISRCGYFVVSGSHDKSLRLWERTEELLVVEEEREQEREAEFEKSLAEGGEPVIPGEKEAEAGFAGKKTLETMKGAERIMEAIELFKEEQFKIDEHQKQCELTGKEIPPPQMNPILKAYGSVAPRRYVLDIVRKVKSSELEESLLVLPFSYVIDLLKLINNWIMNSWEIELCARCLFFLLRVHHNQIVTSQVLLDTIDASRKLVTTKLRERKDQIGFNIAGLKFIQSEMEANSTVFFEDVTEKLRKKKKKKVIMAYT